MNHYVCRLNVLSYSFHCVHQAYIFHSFNYGLSEFPRLRWIMFAVNAVGSVAEESSSGHRIFEVIVALARHTFHGQTDERNSINRQSCFALEQVKCHSRWLSLLRICVVLAYIV